MQMIDEDEVPDTTPAICEPKRGDYRTEIEFDLARVEYWLKTKGENHPMNNMVKLMESSLLSKVGFSTLE